MDRLIDTLRDKYKIKLIINNYEKFILRKSRELIPIRKYYEAKTQ